MSFKENLKLELEYQDIQLKELAAKTGISKNTLGNYITGHNSIPNADSAVKIAQALGVSVEYLVTGNHSQHHEQETPTNIRKLTEKILKLDDYDLLIVENLVTLLINKYSTFKTSR